MKKIVFTIALLAVLSAVAFASTSQGEPNSKESAQPSAKTHKNVHHVHILVPSDHYSM